MSHCYFVNTFFLHNLDRVFLARGNWEHGLADLDCWNIDCLAGLAEVIPVIV